MLGRGRNLAQSRTKPAIQPVTSAVSQQAVLPASCPAFCLWFFGCPFLLKEYQLHSTNFFQALGNILPNCARNTDAWQKTRCPGHLHVTFGWGHFRQDDKNNSYMDFKFGVIHLKENFIFRWLELFKEGSRVRISYSPGSWVHFCALVALWGLSNLGQRPSASKSPGIFF